MRKFIALVGIVATMGVALVACGKEKKPETTAITTEKETTKETETIEETTKETITETTTISTETATTNESTEIIEETTTDLKAQYADPTVDVPQNEPEGVIYNGDDESVIAHVGDYISLTEATGGGYSVANIEILSGDCISVMGKDSVIAEKKGTSIVRCALYDEETNTRTETEVKITVE